MAHRMGNAWCVVLELGSDNNRRVCYMAFILPSQTNYFLEPAKSGSASTALGKIGHINTIVNSPDFCCSDRVCCCFVLPFNHDESASLNCVLMDAAGCHYRDDRLEEVYFSNRPHMNSHTITSCRGGGQALLATLCISPRTLGLLAVDKTR